MRTFYLQLNKTFYLLQAEAELRGTAAGGTGRPALSCLLLPLSHGGKKKGGSSPWADPTGHEAEPNSSSRPRWLLGAVVDGVVAALSVPSYFDGKKLDSGGWEKKKKKRARSRSGGLGAGLGGAASPLPTPLPPRRARHGVRVGFGVKNKRIRRFWDSPNIVFSSV